MAGWRLDSLPRGLESEQISALLSAPDPESSAGRRDRAVLMVLARLGLRGAEVAALRLSDIDWHAGEIAVRGKGSRVEWLPLTSEVGEVLSDYLMEDRPRCSATAVFLTARAPYQALTGACIRAIKGRACDRAGLPRLGAHRLRQTLATTILRAGAPLPEVGQVLRHRSQLRGCFRTQCRKVLRVVIVVTRCYRLRLGSANATTPDCAGPGSRDPSRTEIRPLHPMTRGWSGAP
ncbi:tyrosine-type recombinase/integrase [Streptomyces antimycoticus]|uniref:tyrosine-type recombinase/integrase n=1 Tax=Streptomyces antimycoticus TaxID=68175 RepID=UPI003420B159